MKRAFFALVSLLFLLTEPPRVHRSLFFRRFAPSIAINNGFFKGDSPEFLRYSLERFLTGSGCISRTKTVNFVEKTNSVAYNILNGC